MYPNHVQAYAPNNSKPWTSQLQHGRRADYEAVSSLSRSSPSLPVPGMNPHLHVQRPNKSKARRHHETCQNVAQHAPLRALFFSGRWGLGFRIGLWPEKCLESFPASRMKDIAFKSFETGSLSGHLASCCLTQPLSTSSLCMTDACMRGLRWLQQ